MVRWKWYSLHCKAQISGCFFCTSRNVLTEACGSVEETYCDCAWVRGTHCLKHPGKVHCGRRKHIDDLWKCRTTQPRSRATMVPDDPVSSTHGSKHSATAIGSKHYIWSCFNGGTHGRT